MVASIELSREDKRRFRKEEKRREKAGLPPPAIEDFVTAPAVSMEVDEPEKKGEKASDDMVPSENDTQPEIKKKSRKRKITEEVEAELPTEGSAPTEQEAKKSKKQTRVAEDGAEDAETLANAGEGEEPKKKKKKSKKTEEGITAAPEKSKPPPRVEVAYVPHTFLDPSKDETLPDASSKSLSYAYQFAERNNPDRPAATPAPASAPTPATKSKPSGKPNPTLTPVNEEWKFSKARQNWLTRHIWYEDAVPDTYVDLVVAYLQSIQGGARDAIIKGCQIILNPLSPPTPTTETPANDEAEGVDSVAPKPSRKVTFSDVEEPPAATSAAVAVAVVDPAEEKRVEVRKARAEILKAALLG